MRYLLLFIIALSLLPRAANAQTNTYRISDSMIMTVHGKDTVYAELPAAGPNATYLGRWPDPEFPGDVNAFFKKNLRMPNKPNLQYGNVVLYCTVTTQGRITDPIVLFTPDTSFDAEAKRLISIMPKWKPATMAGVPMQRNIHVSIPFVKP